MRITKLPLCPTCSSPNIRMEADCVWDEKQEKFVLYVLHDAIRCASCGATDEAPVYRWYVSVDYAEAEKLDGNLGHSKYYTVEENVIPRVTLQAAISDLLSIGRLTATDKRERLSITTTYLNLI